MEASHLRIQLTEPEEEVILRQARRTYSLHVQNVGRPGNQETL